MKQHTFLCWLADESQQDGWEIGQLWPDTAAEVFLEEYDRDGEGHSDQEAREVYVWSEEEQKLWKYSVGSEYVIQYHAREMK